MVDPDWLPDPEVQAELDAMQALAPAAPRLSRQQRKIISQTFQNI